jgi:hypothetical protein
MGFGTRGRDTHHPIPQVLQGRAQIERDDALVLDDQDSGWTTGQAGASLARVGRG